MRMAEKTLTNRCRCLGDRKPCITRSRRRNGKCEFSGSSLFGGLRSSAFRPSTFPMFDVTRGPLLLFGISSVALPVWDQKNEAAQSVARSDRARRDRDKSPRELTSSIVPRGTSLHRLADLGYPSVLVTGCSTGPIRRSPWHSPSSSGTRCRRSRGGA